MKKVLIAVLLSCLFLFTACSGKLGTHKKITYWSMWSPEEPQAEVITEAAAAYTEQTGVSVDVQFVGRSGIREKLPEELAKGTVVDLFDEDLDRVHTVFSEYLLDLEGLARANSYAKGAYPGLMTACRVAGGGSLHAIPYQPTVVAVFYNKAIFEKAEIADTPRTWSEFLDVCQRIKDAGYIPMTSDDAYVDCNLGYQLARYVGQDGVKTIAGDNLWAEQPAVRKALVDYQSLAAKGYFSPAITTNRWPAGQDGEFARGDAAMYLSGSWLPGEVAPSVGDAFSIGCFAYPSVDGGVDGLNAATIGAQVFAIHKDSQVAEEAFDFICFLTRGEWDARLSAATMCIPADANNAAPAQLTEAQQVLKQVRVRYDWAAGLRECGNLSAAVAENFSAVCGGTCSADEWIRALEFASQQS